MNIEHSIILEIFKDIYFTQKERNSIESIFEKIDLKKGDTLLKASDVVYNQYYVSDGCLRTYFIDNSTKEHTLQFAIKDWWISDNTAYFTNTKSIMSIECIQNTTIYKISRVAIESLYLEIPQLETFFRKKMEGDFSSFQKRILGSLSQAAKERYTSFIRAYPNIEQSVKNYHVASYLGITTESLSRIRKEITQK
jgi:CRP-like cAMP-binding protein